MFAFQLLVVLIPIFAELFPETIIGQLSLIEIGPVTKNGMLMSEYSLKMFVFSFKCGLLLTLIATLAISISLDVESNGFYLAVFVFAIPILFMMSLVTCIFQATRYLYIKIRGRDRVFSDEEHR